MLKYKIPQVVTLTHDWEQFGNNLYICTVTKNPDYESNSLYPKIRK